MSSPTEQPDATSEPGAPVQPDAPAGRPTARPAASAGVRSEVGLSAPGVVVIVLAGSTVGMIIDAVTGGGIGWIFGVFFILSSLYAALQVRTRDRLSAAIVPPLVFALLILVNGVANGGGFATIAVKTANDLLTYGPMLWIGTGLACAVVGYRSWQLRRA